MSRIAVYVFASLALAAVAFGCSKEVWTVYGQKHGGSYGYTDFIDLQIKDAYVFRRSGPWPSTHSEGTFVGPGGKHYDNLRFASNGNDLYAVAAGDRDFINQTMIGYLLKIENNTVTELGVLEMDTSKWSFANSFFADVHFINETFFYVGWNPYLWDVSVFGYDLNAKVGAQYTIQTQSNYELIMGSGHAFYGIAGFLYENTTTGLINVVSSYEYGGDFWIGYAELSADGSTLTSYMAAQFSNLPAGCDWPMLGDVTVPGFGGKPEASMYCYENVAGTYVQTDYFFARRENNGDMDILDNSLTMEQFFHWAWHKECRDEPAYLP